MKKIFLLATLAAGLTGFGAVLTNEKYVTNTVNETVIREFQTFSTQIIERVITDTAITNAGAVEVSTAYTDEKVAAVGTRIDTVTNNLNALSATVAGNKSAIESTVSSVVDAAHTELTNEVAQLNAKIGACTAADPAAAKSYVDGLIASIPKFKIVVVDAVPTAADADASTVYLVRNEETAGSQLYSEWIKVTKDDVSTMEKLGDAAIKLDGYAKEDFVTNKVEVAQTALQGQINTLSGTVADNKTSADAGIAANAANITAVSNLVVATEGSVKTYADGKASDAESAAKTYAEGQAGTAKSEAIAAAATDATTKADAAKAYADVIKTNVIDTAAQDATAKADAALVSAKSYADGVAGTAETNAKGYADTKVGDLSATVSANKSSADGGIATNAANITAVSNLVVAAEGAAKDYTDTRVGAAIALANENAATNAADIVSLGLRMDATIQSFSEDLAKTNTMFAGLLAQAAGTAAQGVADAAAAKAYAAGVSNNVETLSGTVASNKTDLEGQISAASNNVVAVAAADATAKAGAAESAAKSYADGKETSAVASAKTYTDGAVEAGVLTATNFTKTAIADLATKGSVTSVSNIAESAKSAAATADSKAVAAQGTADTAEAAAATADAKAVAAQAQRCYWHCSWIGTECYQRCLWICQGLHRQLEYSDPTCCFVAR